MENEGLYAEARDVYLRAADRFNDWLVKHEGEPGKQAKQAREALSACRNQAELLTKRHNLRPPPLIRGAAEFVVQYYGVIEGLSGWQSCTSRTEALELLDDARSEGMIPWRLDEDDLAVLTISIYGLKITDQHLSEPPLMREPLYAVASTSCVQEDEGQYVILLTSGDMENEEYFCHVLEVPLREQADEIISLLQETVKQAFDLAYPSSPAPPAIATHPSQSMSGMRINRGPSEAGLLAFDPVRSHGRSSRRPPPGRAPLPMPPLVPPPALLEEGESTALPPPPPLESAPLPPPPPPADDLPPPPQSPPPPVSPFSLSAHKHEFLSSISLLQLSS